MKWFFLSLKHFITKATATNQSAKFFFVILSYIIAFIVLLPQVLENLANAQSPLYAYLLLPFFPLLWFLYFFSTNFLGFIVLLFCGCLRFAILREYIVLFVLFLLCAYPSFLLNDTLPNFFSNFLEVAMFIKDKHYFMVFAYYAKQIVWAFLLFSAFDLLYFWRKKQKIPPLVYRNFIFSICLYIATFSLYSLHFHKFIWH
ncbi:hypothetical protein [Helicobacter fennelliae]|uniref:hypothetical protein n=1 Tax=Helicobacter fennelliae TaxID=215 RepID=UPI000DF8D61C|nr:hypothetical protein [Helicobacter fennelliae]STQ84067.1 Uncharacterised protein [Helicobacter fennelliae]